MEVSLAVILVSFCSFFAAGFVDAIAGGGGLITLPALLLTGIPPHYALGSGKFSAMAGALSALWTFIRNNLVIKKIAPVGFASACIGSFAGSALALYLDNDTLGKTIIFLLPAGMILSFASGRSFAKGAPLPKRWLWSRVIGIGLLIGMYDGFFGPGAGSFFIIAQNYLLRMDLVRASATAKVYNLASNLGATLTFAAGGVVLYTLSIPCAVGSILGNQLGVHFAISRGANVVRHFLYLVLALLFVTLCIRYIL